MIENYRLPYLLPVAKKEENAKNALCILLFYNRMTHVFVSFIYIFFTQKGYTGFTHLQNVRVGTFAPPHTHTHTHR